MTETTGYELNKESAQMLKDGATTDAAAPAQASMPDRLGADSFRDYPSFCRTSRRTVRFMATEQARSPKTLQQVAPMSHRVLTLM